MSDAASPDAAGFKALFTRFAAMSDDAVNVWIVQAALRFSSAAFGAQWTMAVYLYVAHQLTVFTGDSGESEVRGPVTSESVGDVSRSYGSISIENVPESLSEFTTTRYGVQLINIIQSRSAARARVVTATSSS